MIPMVVSIVAICGLRAIWVFFVFPTEKFHSLIGIYTIYPISWSLGLLALAIALFLLYGRVKKKLELEALAESDKTEKSGKADDISEELA